MFKRTRRNNRLSGKKGGDVEATPQLMRMRLTGCKRRWVDCCEICPKCPVQFGQGVQRYRNALLCRLQSLAIGIPFAEIGKGLPVVLVNLH